MKKRILSCFLALAMALSLLPMSVLAVGDGSTYVKNGDPVRDNNGVTISKTATYKSTNEYEITLSVTTPGDVTIPGSSADVVLVIDSSGSMDDNRKMSTAKTSAKNFAQSLLDTEGATVRIAVVDYDSDATVACEWASNINTVTSGINAISAGGGTHIQGGIYQARQLLRDSTAANKVIVVISDGEPTYSFRPTEISGTLDGCFNFLGHRIGNASVKGDSLRFEGFVYNYTEYSYRNRHGGTLGNGNSNSTSWDVNWTCKHGESGSKEFSYSHAWPTIAEAALAKDGGSEIYSVYLGSLSGVSKTTMEGIATDTSHCFDTQNSDLGALLERIAGSVTSTLAGAITDPMGENIILGDVSNLPGVTKTETGLTWTPDSSQGKENLDGSTTYTVTYPITVDADNLTEDGFLPANRTTTFNYRVGSEDKSLDFNVPQVYGEATKYTVTYEWTDAPEAGTEVYNEAGEPVTLTLPIDNNEYVKEQPYTVDGAYGENDTVFTHDQYGNVNGQYVFSGWKLGDNVVSGSQTMGDSDVSLMGVWTYTQQDVAIHNVTYDWGTTPTDVYDAAGNEVTLTLPTDSEEYVKGQSYTVDGTYGENYTVFTHDQYGNVNGKYVFSGWKLGGNVVSGSQTMGDSDVSLMGVWTYTQQDVAIHNVTYDWGTTPTDVYDAAGNEVTLTLPTDNNEYVKGQSYTVDGTYGENYTVFTHDQYGNVNGKYVFSGWKLGGNIVSGSQTMGDSDVSLMGVWTYTQLDVDILSVTYDWGTTPTDVYDAAGNEVTLTLPTDNNEYVKGQSYTVDGTYGENYTVFTHDQYGNVNGKYVFSGWKLGDNVVSGSQTMGDSNVTLTGVWTYTEQVVATYSVTYTDGVEDSVIFEDEVHNNLVNGAPTPAYNNGATPTREGYEFTGWSPAVAETVTANATYTAQWEEKEAPAPDPDWDVSRSKTATNLDKNYESQVTLSLPSAEEELASDVVFVLDKSTSAEVETQILSMLQILNEQIENTDATIKVGVVVFNKEAHRVLGLTELNSENMGAIENAITYNISSGTNTHAGLLAGKAMLDEDTSVDSNRKYLIFVSDGITYMYNEKPTVTAWSFWADSWNTWAGPDNWSSKYGNTNAPEDWGTWLTDIEAKVSAQGTTYEYPYGGEVSKSTPQENWQTAYANSIDKALYLTYETYQEIQEAGYQCYAVTASSNASYPWATSFMGYLSEGQTVSFEDIQKDIYYLVDAGSYVVDVIGSGTDNKGNAYNFDFVNQAGKLTLKVGEETYSAVSIPAQDGATASYGFGDAHNGIYPYVLNYYQNGTTGVASEHFVWEINVPVSNFAHVQLTYSVKLTNPQSRAGTYGQYDADGSEGYTSLYTNTSAVLTPVDSNGVQGPEQIFAKPTVSYTIKKHDGGGTVEPPVLDTENHYGYIVGYDDGTVRPNGKITRAEVATIFFRLLTDESRDAYWCQTNDFSDVSASDWFNNAISTLTNAGILDGYEDGTFRPNGNITRAEFATIAVRFFDLTYEGEDLFPDISDHWARDYINQAAAAGFVNGYEDGTFRPNNAITRAEAVTLVNRTLERKPHKAHLLADMIQWPDNMDQTTWYYADIQEATNSHEYYMTTSEQGEEYEIWTKILPVRDWPALEKEWSDANSSTGTDVTN